MDPADTSTLQMNILVKSLLQALHEYLSSFLYVVLTLHLELTAFHEASSHFLWAPVLNCQTCFTCMRSPICYSEFREKCDNRRARVYGD